MKRTVKWAAHAAAAILFLAPAAQAQPAPTATDIGTLGGMFSQATSISESGHVVGASTLAGDAETHAFIWTSQGGMLDVGTLGGTVSLPAGTFSLGDQPGRGVNNRGDVVGVSSTAGNLQSHAFLWTSQDGIRDLGTLGGTYSQAQYVSDQGEVVGLASISGDSEAHAFLWTAQGGMTDLGTLGGVFSRANAMNAAGIAGTSTTATNLVHAFFWSQKGGIRDLGTLGGTFSEAFGINVRGEVTGRSTLPGESQIHAFLWTEKDGMRDLGTLGGTFSQPSVISDSGVVTGFSTLAGEAQFHAFVWSAGGGKGQGASQMRDLGTLGGSFSQSLAVNMRGDVVGASNTTGDAETHAFLWTERDGIKDLGTLGGNFSIGWGVNNRGEIVAGAAGSDGTIHAAVYR